MWEKFHLFLFVICSKLMSCIVSTIYSLEPDDVVSFPLETGASNVCVF